MIEKRTLVQSEAFSSGQVGSRLWLCEELGRVLSTKHSAVRESVWLYGGWQGVLGLMMLTRPEFKTAMIRSFDIDPTCADVANTICENWVWREWQFRAFTKDCNDLDPAVNGEYGERPSIVINSSVEHFDSRVWFEKIPEGTLVVLQASDFEHDGATSLFKKLEDLETAYPLREVFFRDKLKFDYSAWSFHRLMVIGIR